jgi:hypothetical protein
MIFHLVIIVLEALPILIPHEVDTHQESGNGGLPLAANWLIITRSSDTARLR